MSTVAQEKIKKTPSTPTRSKKAAKAAAEEKAAVNLVTPIASKAREESLNVTPKVSHRKPRLSLIGSEIEGEAESENLDLSNVSASNIVSPSKPIKTTLQVDSKVEEAYKVIRKVTGVLGGNGSTGAIYGELTLRALQRVYNIMVEKCNLSSASRMIDVGAGLGKPNFHAAQDPAVRLSLGMELEDIRWNVSVASWTNVVNSRFAYFPL